jgi:hypothetical protein
MSSKADRTKVAILKVLSDLNGPAGAARIVEGLSALGHSIRPRTARLYLLQTDRDGLTQFVSRRRGRAITDRGREELLHANVMEKVGFVSAKVDTLGYRMTYNLRANAGTIVANVALLDERGLAFALREMAQVFAAGYGMGSRLAIARQGGKVGGCSVPEGMVAVGTACSVTVNGIMLGERVPVSSRFGGLLEIRDRKPVRFVELIEYAGTTLDPLEAFIRSGMTSVRRCARTGSGLIGASFREIPSAAIQEVSGIQQAMKKQGLGGILAIGVPNRPLLDIPVREGRVGLVVVGGMNPLAAVHEAGVRVSMFSLAGLEDIGAFVDYRKAVRRHA